MLLALALLAAVEAAPINVLVLFTDDHRRTAVGAEGIEPVKTPNIDALYREGTVFTRNYTMGGPHGALCIPSRAMLMTGRNLWHLGPRNPQTGAVDVGSVSPEYKTWPEVFRENGYQTFFTGKWHNDKPAVNRLFTDGGSIYFGGMHTYETNGHFEPRIHTFDPKSDYPESDRKRVETYSSELYAGDAIDFLKTRRPDRPFAMYVAFTSPHDPRQAPAKWHAMYPPNRIALPLNFLPQHPFDNGDMKVRDEVYAPLPRTPERTKREISEYYAMVSEVDAQIGRVLGELKRQGLDKNTLVVLLGDNGLAVGQHGLLGKQNLYEHSMGMPLVFRGPGIPRGQRRSTFVYHHDVAPTVLTLAGLPTPKTMEATNLESAIKVPRAKVRSRVYHAYQNKQRAIHDGDWKLILYNVDGMRHTQLFNLRDDPWEMKDLSKQPAQKLQIERLTKLLIEEMRRYEDPAKISDFELPTVIVNPKKAVSKLRP